MRTGSRELIELTYVNPDPLEPKLKPLMVWGRSQHPTQDYVALDHDGEISDSNTVTFRIPYSPRLEPVLVSPQLWRARPTVHPKFKAGAKQLRSATLGRNGRHLDIQI